MPATTKPPKRWLRCMLSSSMSCWLLPLASYSFPLYSWSFSCPLFSDALPLLLSAGVGGLRVYISHIYIHIYMFMCVIYVIQSQYPMCPGLLNINDYKPNLFRSHFLIQHCWNESGVEAIGATAWSLRRWRAQSPRVAAPTRSQALWAMVGLYIWG